METAKDKYNKIVVPAMMKKFGYKNKLAVSRIEKVLVGVGTGSIKDEKKKEVIVDRLSKITGQKSSARPAKKSIASFKIREGMVIGQLVTLRGSKMYDFIDRLINIAIPRTRDFQGLKESAVDSMGNFSMGIKEHTVFPETTDEELSKIFSLGVNVVTTAKSHDEALELLKLLGFPFKKES